MGRRLSQCHSALVRLQAVALQDAMYRGFARRCPDHGTVRAQTARGPSQRPSSGVGQWLGLAIKRHDAHLQFLPVDGWVSRTRMIMELSCPLGAANPATHGTDRAACQLGDGVERNPGIGQCDDRFSANRRRDSSLRHYGGIQAVLGAAVHVVQCRGCIGRAWGWRRQAPMGINHNPLEFFLVSPPVRAVCCADRPVRGYGYASGRFEPITRPVFSRSPARPIRRCWCCAQ
jgi:hypothetical protein